MWTFINQVASPRSFYYFSGKLMPWVWVVYLIFLVYGLVAGLYYAPPDYQQGDAFRIIYIHVPSAALSLSIFVIMALMAVINLIWRLKLADVIAQASAPIGAWFAFLALVTGSLWGKPMWGTWWIWDARLTSELVLLFLYLGVIGLRSAITSTDAGTRACSILTLVGVVDIPIIHYSVYWWNTLHQKATLLKLAKPSIEPSMLYPLLAMLAAFCLYYLALMLMRARAEILRREAKTQWVRQVCSTKCR